MPAESVDAIVCDPPYGLSFMGKGWDHGVPGVEFWEAALRVLKPGGHLLAFGGTRTWHRLACAVEDAGFEIRDTIMYIYGSGFPKSLDVSKAIDKVRDDRDAILAITTFMADHADRLGITRADLDAHMGTSDMGGWWLSRLRHRCAVPKVEQWLRIRALLGLPGDMDAEVWRLNGRKGTPGEAWDQREVIGAGFRVDRGTGAVPYGSGTPEGHYDITAPATPDAARWQGWGTALKPAWEPIVVARKPLDGTVAANVLHWGTGALNIDACRVGYLPSERVQTFWNNRGGATINVAERAGTVPTTGADAYDPSKGRWPANLIHDGSDEVLAGFPVTGASKASERGLQHSGRHGGLADIGANIAAGTSGVRGHDDAGGTAARFFYCAKASKRDRDEGLDGFEESKPTLERNHHPTVKPTDLMRYLVRLVTPPGGIVLDPFMGSGSTGKAAVLEGFNFIGIELDVEYIEIARARIAHALQSDKQQTLAL